MKSRLVIVPVVIILVLMPFHALLTVWLGSNFGHYAAWRLWKEILMALMLPAAIFLMWRSRLNRVEKSLAWLIIAYTILSVILAVVAFERGEVNLQAGAEALVLNLRLFVFLAICWTAARHSKWLRTHWREMLLIPAAVVVSFGILQLFLPPDFLRHFGYGPHTIVAYETVDQKPQYVRLQSTLRGANPLGAYLVLILSAVAVFLFGSRRSNRALWVTFLGAGMAVLFFTYSRSAYIGVAAALLAAGWWSLRSGFARRFVLIGLAVAVIVGAAAALALRHNDQFQNTFFHTDEHSRSARSSNQARSSALRQGWDDLLHQPLGRGPGTAGPASQHNNHPPRVAENYYLQLGQEVGWLGLSLFVAINLLIARALWQRRDDPLVLTLLASLIGITLINMVSHAWTDDTLALVWWGFAGLALAEPLTSKGEVNRGR